MKCIVRHKKTKYDNHCSFMHAHFYWGLMSGELQGQNTGGGSLSPSDAKKLAPMLAGRQVKNVKSPALTIFSPGRITEKLTH